MLTKEQILAAADIRVKEVDVPEWGGTVFVRTPTGREQDQFDKSLEGKDGKRDGRRFSELFCALYLSDAEGNRIFTDSDAPMLGKKSMRAIRRIMDAALELNGLKKEAVEEMEKNFDAMPPSDSGTTSPDISVAL